MTFLPLSFRGGTTRNLFRICHSELVEETKEILHFVQNDRKGNSREVMGIYYVYMITNKNNNVLYTGVTNNIERRLYEHKNKLIEGFTSKYNINKLVYFNSTTDVNEAIAFEKRIKGWSRKKKNELIELGNPLWKDLSEEWYND